MDQTVLNRLLAAKHIIQTSGPPLSTSSTALSVARKLLAAHDAAELAFLAFLAHSQVVVTGKDGQVVKEPSFHQLADTALKVISERSTEFAIGTKLQTFQALIALRKLFKHSGLLVDSPSNMHLFDDVVQSLDEMCLATAGVPLLGLSEQDALSSEELRELFAQAREALEQGHFKLSMEKTAQALSHCFWYSPSPDRFSLGIVASEDALLLSGRGIDPAAYIRMQRLLPKAHFWESDCSWELREYGHPGNWTEPKARFCLATALDIAVKLQAAPSHPQPSDFYDFFEDVVEVVIDGPEAVLIQRSPWLSLPSKQSVISDFKVGDRVFGKATGRLDGPEEHTDELKVDFEFAEWVAIEDADSERIEVERNSSSIFVLWIKQSAVTISYRLKLWKAKWSENPDWTYEDMKRWQSEADLENERLAMEKRWFARFERALEAVADEQP